VAIFIAEDRHKYERELLLARQRAEELLEREQQAREALHVAQGERDRQQALAEDRAFFAEQMVAIVSHDLRNPLSVIRMSSYILARSGLTPQQQLALDRLIKSNERATRLISDLLDFSSSRLGNGLQVDVAPINLHSLVSDAVEDLRVANPHHEIEHLKAGSGKCHGSGDRLTQLIGNLVVNAITYGTPERPVVVTSTIGPDQFSVAVHNDGAPIPELLLPQLFDPMTRGDSEAAGGIRSVGLGLFIVRQIAQAHGGEVDVTSTQAQGTTFLATFPCSRGNIEM
jgi:sigma-B regulation protein RsbU (phosphoserine phosphatase)